jgi:hypothetical protein
MLPFVVFLASRIPVVIILVRQIRRSLYLRDAAGNRVRPGFRGVSAGRRPPAGALLSWWDSVRVVRSAMRWSSSTPSRRASGSRTQGVTFVWPVISQTAHYDLRRLEYTMSSTEGEGRKAS